MLLTVTAICQIYTDRTDYVHWYSTTRITVDWAVSTSANHAQIKVNYSQKPIIQLRFLAISNCNDQSMLHLGFTIARVDCSVGHNTGLHQKFQATTIEAKEWKCKLESTTTAHALWNNMREFALLINIHDALNINMHDALLMTPWTRICKQIDQLYEEAQSSYINKHDALHIAWKYTRWISTKTGHNLCNAKSTRGRGILQGICTLTHENPVDKYARKHGNH